MKINELLMNNPHIKFKHLDETNMEDGVMFFQEHAICSRANDDSYVLILSNGFNSETSPHDYNDFINQYIPDCQFIEERLSNSLRYFYNNIIVATGELFKVHSLKFSNMCKASIRLFFDIHTQELKEIKIFMFLHIEHNEKHIYLNISTNIDKDYNVSFSVMKNGISYNNMERVNQQFLNIICMENFENVIDDLYFDYSFEDVLRLRQLLIINKY